MLNVVFREFTRKEVSGPSLHTEATEESTGENLGGARGSKEGP